jgi:hypothetical protein
MNGTYSQHVVRREISHVRKLYNGGHITYIKLYFKLFKMQKVALSVFPWYQKMWEWFTFALKTPWWIIIKPFGVVYSKKVTYKGEFVVINDNLDLDTFDVKKSIVHRLFYIPVFMSPWFINQEDMDFILKR